jgi:NAD(P)H-hydrate epimerase
MTVTMAGIKQGLIRFPAATLTGELRIASIGSIEKLSAYADNTKIILTGETIKGYLPERPIDSHKGTFGTAFIISGSVNFTGAALLAGQAAYRVGAGLVTLAVPSPLHEALSGQFPESTWVLLPHEMGVISADAANVVWQNNDRATAILIGPGFGLEDTTKEFLHRFLSIGYAQQKGKIGFIHNDKIDYGNTRIQIPVVVDADGLKLMSKIENWAELLPSQAVLTPHPGEMAFLTGLSTEEIQKDRIKIAKQYSSKWGHVVVLKGAFTVIANPEGIIAVVPVASAALAKAGTGDVLAGLIVGLRAQGLEAYPAACAGAWIHAKAGLLAAKRLGNTASVIASDVLNAIPQVISELQ